MLRTFTSSFYLLIYLNLSLEISKVSGFILFTLSLTCNREVRLRKKVFLPHTPFPREKKITNYRIISSTSLLQESESRVAQVTQTSPRLPNLLRARRAAKRTASHRASGQSRPRAHCFRQRSAPHVFRSFLPLVIEVFLAKFELHSVLDSSALSFALKKVLGSVNGASVSPKNPGGGTVDLLKSTRKEKLVL